jgi:toxin ParE1/3/4
MPDYELTDATKKDLRGVSAYTEKTWGKEQEKAYREILRAALRVIAKAPKIGQKRDELAEDLRSFPVGNHIAYYVEKGKGIEIARILHPSIDREKAIKR